MTAAVYGYCPHCGAPGKSRERRLNGNDTCEAGHVYPTRSAQSGVYPLPAADPQRRIENARDLLRKIDQDRELLRRAVEDQAVPKILAVHAASPGRIDGLFLDQYMRVGLVERAEDDRGVFDLVWLEYAAWRPFGNDPDLLLVHNTSVGWRLVRGVPETPFLADSMSSHTGVVWLRERGRSVNGQQVPWVHCGVNQRSGAGDYCVDRLHPESDVDKAVFPAACAWLVANGGPVIHPRKVGNETA